MEIRQILRDLGVLLHLDHDAALAYEQALKSLPDRETYERFAAFKSDHERHASDIASAIRTLGGRTPERTRDMLGYFMEGFTAERTPTGVQGILSAMLENEKMINEEYADIRMKNLPPSVADLVDRNFRDEQNHLAFIEAALNLLPAGVDKRPGQ